MIKLLCASVLLFLAAQVSAQQEPEDLALVFSKPELFSASIARGEERVTLCRHCHGADGNSMREDIPSLAQQNPAYLLKQFDLFATGERKSYVMNQLAKALTAAERRDVSLFFASQARKVNQDDMHSNPALLQRGEKVFARTCVACHGNQGKGSLEFPNVAGQMSSYIEKTLLNYRDEKSVRPNSQMNAVAATLVDDQDIKAVAAYVSSLGG